MPIGGPVIAAGAVVTRRGGTEVLLVHRPRYDDWSFPKGKQEPGEHVTATAVREVLEETGVPVRLGRPLRSQKYVVSGGRAKTVHYWVGRVAGDPRVDGDVSAYQPNREIDGVRWVAVTQAASVLSYLDDVELLDQFRELPLRTDALVLLRHGRARRRRTWTGADPLRPLTRVGLEQARTVVPVLAAYGISRVLTSPSRRCRQTVAPCLTDRGVGAEVLADLSEEGSSRRGVDAVLAEVWPRREGTLICSHRPVLPLLTEWLGVDEDPLAPAEMLVCHRRSGALVATERHLVR